LMTEPPGEFAAHAHKTHFFFAGFLKINFRGFFKTQLALSFRRPYAIVLFQLNLLLFPVVVGVILLTSLVSAPLLPLFTLPVFCPTFPRPARFWPGTTGIINKQY
jgi:hypothetical protein